MWPDLIQKAKDGGLDVVVESLSSPRTPAREPARALIYNWDYLVSRLVFSLKKKSTPIQLV